MVPMVLLIVALPVTVSIPPLFAHLSRSIVIMAVSTSSLTIFAIIEPTKKMIAAPIRFGTKSSTLVSIDSTGPVTLPRLNTFKMATSPNNHTSSDTTRPSIMPMLSPELVPR